MKVALAFFGQPRFVENQEIIQTYKENIIDKYNTDVFSHTWWDDDFSFFNYSSWSNIASTSPIPKNAIEVILKYYKPVVLEKETPRSFLFSTEALKFLDTKFTGKHPNGDHWNHKNYSNILSQLYSISKVSKIVRSYSDSNNVNYDWVILARYDTVLINFPDLTSLNNEKFYLPGHHPRFPDTIQFFPQKYLQWAENVYTDADLVYENIWEPSPEAFKFFSFLKRFKMSDLSPVSMDANCIRK
jgi:hypothetical protein